MNAVLRQFDPAQIEMLRGLRGGGFLPQLLGTYRDQLARELPVIAAALAAGDLAALGRVAHTLKSASFSVGARRLGELCTAIEHDARKQQGERLPELCRELQDAHALLLPELETLL